MRWLNAHFEEARGHLELLNRIAELRRATVWFSQPHRRALEAIYAAAFAGLCEIGDEVS